MKNGARKRADGAGLPSESGNSRAESGEKEADAFEPWRVRLFGEFRAERHGRKAIFGLKKAANLLAHLVFHLGETVSKERLVESFWPDSDSEKGRHSLRMAASSLRSALAAPDWNPEVHLPSTRDTLEASSCGFVTDVQEFRAHLAAANSIEDPSSKACHLRAATGLYVGPLLDGFAEEWIYPQSLPLEESFAQAACELILIQAQEGDLAGAAGLGKRAIALCPTREDLHVALMRAYALAGETSMAIQQYEELERMVDETWGEEPGKAAREVLESLPRTAIAHVRADTIAPESPSPGFASKPPTRRAAFFGREAELGLVRQQLASEDGFRLITLIGLGGFGKTRIAEEARIESFDSFERRSWMVSLLGCRNEDEVQEALMAPFEGLPQRVSDPVQVVGARIGSQPGLLVIDNCEQVLREASAVVEALLANCPKLRILATSRVPFGLPYELAVPVGGLPVPSEGTDLETLLDSPIVRLLANAAQCVRPGFAVTPDNARGVQALCAMLEGIPLAVELAAAQLGTLSPAELVGAIGRRTDLADNDRRIESRHRHLRSVLEWSVHQLPAEEQKALAKLSVCRGSFERDLAEAILGSRSDKALNHLSSSSLVSWSERSDTLRFCLLETVRELGQRLLEKDAKAKKDACAALVRWATHLTEGIHQVESHSEASLWAELVSTETVNVLAALQACVDGVVEPEEAWKLAFPLVQLCEYRGWAQPWIRAIESLLEATRERLSQATLSQAHATLRLLYYNLRDIRNAHRHITSAVRAADEDGSPLLRGRCRSSFSVTASLLGQFEEAQRAATEAMELLLVAGEPVSAARSALFYGWVVFDRGDEVESEPFFRRALELGESSGDTETIGSSLLGLACSVGHRSHPDAQPIFDRALEQMQELGKPGQLGHFYFYRSLIDYRHGRFQAAMEGFAESVKAFTGARIALGQTPLTIGGTILAALGRYDDAALCWGRAEALRESHGMTMFPTQQRDFDREFPKVQKALSEEGLRRSMRAARSATDEEIREMICRAVWAVRA